MNQTICRRLWANLIVDLQNQQYRFCQYHEKKDLLDGENFFKVINKEETREKRDKILSGNKIEDCSFCYNIEEQGFKSPREYERWNSYVKQNYNNDFSDMTLSKMIKRVDIFYGNQCNMECLYCDWRFSSRWEKGSLERKEIPPRKEKKEFLYFEDKFWNWFFISSKNIRTIFLNGGELLQNENFHKSLDILLNAAIVNNNNFLPDLHLHTSMNTHPTIFLSFLENLKKLSKYYRIHLSYSTESIDKKFDFIRIGSNKDFINKNLHNLLSTKIDNFIFSIQMTINALCITSLNDLIKEIHGYKSKYNVVPELSMFILEHPDILSPYILTEDFDIFALKISEYLNECYLENKNESWKRNSVLFLEIAENIRKQPLIGVEEKRKKFYEWISIMSRRHKMNFIKIFPEYIRFWSECGSLFFEEKIDSISRRGQDDKD